MLDRILSQEAGRFPRHLREDLLSEGMLALCKAQFPEAPKLQRIIARRAMVEFFRKETHWSRKDKERYAKPPAITSIPAYQESDLILRECEDTAPSEAVLQAQQEIKKRGTAYHRAKILRHVALGNLPGYCPSARQRRRR